MTTNDRLAEIRRTIIDPAQARLVRRVCATRDNVRNASSTGASAGHVARLAVEAAEAAAEAQGYERAVNAILAALAGEDGPVAKGDPQP